MPMRAVRWLITPILLVALAAGSWYGYQQLQPERLPPGVIYANGRIEGTEIAVSAEITGRVTKSPAVEGTQLQSGDLLVQIDPATYQTQLNEARAERAAIEAEAEVLQAKLATAHHHLETAQAELDRQQQLQARDAGSAQTVEAAEDRQREARSAIRVLEAQLSQTKSQLKSADEQIERFQLQLDKTEIHSPIDGTVLVKGIEAGELATAGRLMTVLVDLSRLELRVYLPERELGKIKLRDPAKVRVDAFPGRSFDARVKRIDQQSQFTPRDVHMPEERVRVVFGVTLAVENEGRHLHPGMPADAWIKWNAEAPWPDQLIIPE